MLQSDWLRHRAVSAIRVQWVEDEKVMVPHSGLIQCILVKSEFENSYLLLYILLKS